jgi:hypothetical protein
VLTAGPARAAAAALNNGKSTQIYTQDGDVFASRALRFGR